VRAVRDRGLDTLLLTSISEVNGYLSSPAEHPTCIILDIMFPADNAMPRVMTSEGLTAGMPLFASLRSHFPKSPVVVFTSSSSIAATQFFKDQDNCSLYYKTDLLPDELADVVLRVAEDRGEKLAAQLASCSRGQPHAKLFEDVCVRILEYLFVPPLKRVLPQSRRSDGRTIRDAVMPNDAESHFWASLRSELDARHIVAEFKNYAKAIGKEEVIQLREYLARKTIGRFGLLISRTSASESAVAARRDAYSDQDCLILFLADKALVEMIHLRRRGGDPAAALQRMKEEFELAY
ncbi:MAG: hypothetical protein ACRDGA_08925, partial [Bacteroidota bacterium]